MARRVVSVLRGVRRIPGSNDPTLEANAYAVAEDIELALVLRGGSCELAVAGADSTADEIAGVALAPADAARDLRGLLESGVAVYVTENCLAREGLGYGDLVDGVNVIDSATLAELLREADAVVGW